MKFLIFKQLFYKYLTKAKQLFKCKQGSSLRLKAAFQQNLSRVKLKLVKSVFLHMATAVKESADDFERLII
jgi:hypothetical protein